MKRLGLTALFGVALLATVTSAADDMDDFRVTLHELMETAAQLRDEGKNEQADALRERMRKIFRAAMESRSARRRRDTRQREGALDERRRERLEQVRAEIGELRNLAERVAAEGDKNRAEQMLDRARELQRIAERGEFVETRERERRRESHKQERVERIRQQIRELEVAANLIAAEGNQQRAEEMLARANELREELEQGPRRERRDVRRERERERPSAEVDLPREINQAIDKLREHGNTEIAMALQRRVAGMLRELRGRNARRERDMRRDRPHAPVNPEVSQALQQLRHDLNELRENPRTHPEIGHVIRDLRAQVQQLREEFNELRETVGESR